MESLSEGTWDVVIAGTSLSQALLALSLSKCDLKILHVDKHDYYGGIDAGLSLDQAQKWADLRQGASVERNNLLNDELHRSQAYTICLKPQIIYAKSRFLPTLVSSQIHTQLEFQAVGSFWVHADGKLQKIPSNREDVFADENLSVKDKRRLMGLLRHVLDGEKASSTVSEIDGSSLEATLEHQFKLADNLKPPVQALTLSTSMLAHTSFDAAMSRLKRHLTSMGYFGPGLAAVMAKYGGNSEISQVACRAGAVGGFVYLLGQGLKSLDVPDQANALVQVELSDGTIVQTKHVVGMRDDLPHEVASYLPTSSTTHKIAYRTSIISKPLRHLFTSTSENVPAVAVILVSDGQQSQPPVYLQVHSDDSGECPSQQCIIYASVLGDGVASQERLEAAIISVLKTNDDTDAAEILWTLSYTLDVPTEHTSSLYTRCYDSTQYVMCFPDRSHDIAFDDSVLDSVKAAWEFILGEKSTEYDFLRFEEKKDVNDDSD